MSRGIEGFGWHVVMDVAAVKDRWSRGTAEQSVPDLNVSFRGDIQRRR